MSKQTKDKLILLINSLNKSEKRSFRLYVNRNGGSSESKFVLLFNQLEKDGLFNEEKVLKNIPEIQKKQLSNIKANLYKQLLTCLRLIERSKIGEIEVREQIDFAKILYEKGLYKSCLEILDKAKKQALAINFETLALSILYFEKRIESQHVTGSMSEKAEILVKQSNNLLEDIDKTNQLSNLSLLLYGRYLKYGYVKNENDYKALKVFFSEHLPKLDPLELSFYQKLYLYQSHVWYYNMAQDFVSCYKYSQKWVDLFSENPKLIPNSAATYVKGIHNVLNSLFMSGSRIRFNESFIQYEDFQIEKIENVSRNEISNYYLFYHTHSLNKMLINGMYENNDSELEAIRILISRNEYNWDINRILVLKYKLACVYFGNNDLDNCIECLNDITVKNYPSFREDIQSFARILNLIAHFDLGNEELVTYKLKSLYRYLGNLKDLETVQIEIIRFLRRTTVMDANKMKREFKDLRDKLMIVKNRPYEKRPFLYLDIISWLEAKMNGTTIGEVIKRKIYG